MQVDKLLRTLATAQDTLSSVIANLKRAEGSLPAPGTGVAGQPHQAIDSIARSSQDLNDVLRRIDQAQAELPAIRDPSEMLSQHELSRVRLTDVDAATQARNFITAVRQHGYTRATNVRQALGRSSLAVVPCSAKCVGVQSTRALADTSNVQETWLVGFASA